MRCCRPLFRPDARALAVAVGAALLVSHPVVAQADAHVWRVRAGDALSLLAQRFGVSVADLKTWNNLGTDRIYVGQKLRVAPTGPKTRAERKPGPRPAPEASPEPPSADPALDQGTYTVQPGDTIGELAARFGISTDDFRAYNEGLDPNLIQVGQILRVRSPRRRVEHTVERGETLTHVAAQYGVKLSEIRNWNPGQNPNVLSIGHRLVVYTDEPESRSQAVGTVTRGRLVDGVQLSRHPGYVIRNLAEAWGTEETILWVKDAFETVRRTHGARPRARIHDISNQRGGWMAGHVSHQNGRDVDLSYYQIRCPRGVCPMQRFHPSELDVARQWTLFSHWLERGQVDAIFMDYALQAPLYRHAQKQGATAEELHRWFQYPRGRGFPVGVIRHYRRHHDHAHVRFVCPESDPECR